MVLAARAPESLSASMCVHCECEGAKERQCGEGRRETRENGTERGTGAEATTSKSDFRSTCNARALGLSGCLQHPNSAGSPALRGFTSIAVSPPSRRHLATTLAYFVVGILKPRAAAQAGIQPVRRGGGWISRGTPEPRSRYVSCALRRGCDSHVRHR